MKVYLVEDSPLVRERMAAMLRAVDGVEIVGESEDATAAIAGITATLPDIVVLDLQLAGSSGLSVLRQLNQFCPEIISIVLTNYAVPEFRKECLSAGARHFFDKTAEFGKVRETIEFLSNNLSHS
ncbi:MAG: response regulator transcription factor [Pseudomonadota bacterium]